MNANQIQSQMQIGSEFRNTLEATLARETAQPIIKSSPSACQNSELPASQPFPHLPSAGQDLPEVANALPGVATDLPGPCQAGPEQAAASGAGADPESPSHPSFAACLNEVADSLHYHVTGHIKFDQLTPAQRQAILALLEQYPSRLVADILAEPPPRGLNFKISKTALNNFRNTHAARAAETRHQQNAQAAADLLSQSQNPEEAFQKSMDRLLKIRLLTLSSDAESDLDDINKAMTSLTKLRRQILAERKQAHVERTQSDEA